MNINDVNELLKNKITREEYIECFKVISEEINNHKTDGIIKTLVNLKEQVIINELYSSRIDIIFINILFIRAYLYQNVAWRARSFVNECIELLEDVKFDKDLMMGAEIYKILGDASSCYLDCATSYICYGHSVSLYLETDYPLEYTTYVARSMIIAINQLPNRDEIIPTDEEIKDTFKEYSDIIIKAKNGIGYIKHDKVEQTKEFQDVYDEVMEEVEIIASKNNVNIPQYKWMLMADALLKRGIIWKSPQVMNPKVKFD